MSGIILAGLMTIGQYVYFPQPVLVPVVPVVVRPVVPVPVYVPTPVYVPVPTPVVYPIYNPYYPFYPWR